MKYPGLLEVNSKGHRDNRENLFNEEYFGKLQIPQRKMKQDNNREHWLD